MTPFHLSFLVRLHESHVIELSLRPGGRGIEAAVIRVRLESGQSAVLSEESVHALLEAGQKCAALHALWLKELGRCVPTHVPRALRHVLKHGASFASDLCAELARREQPLPELMAILQSAGPVSRLTKVGAHLFLEGLIRSSATQPDPKMGGLLLDPLTGVDGEVEEEGDDYLVRWNRPLLFRARHLSGALFYAALLGLRERPKTDEDRVSRVTRRLRSVTGRSRRQSDRPGR